VVDPAGHPIEAAQVFAVMESPIKPRSFHAWTDEHGRFEWGDAPAEAVGFLIRAKGPAEGHPA
jgi:hypothetical protein